MIETQNIIFPVEDQSSSSANITPSSGKPKTPKFQTLKNQANSVDDFSALPFYLSYTPILLFYYGLLTGGRGIWYFSPIILTFVFVPLLDFILPPLKLNPTAEQEKILEKQFKFQLPVWLWVPTQIFSVIFTCYVFGHWDLTLTEQIGLLLTVGLMGGQSINVAHELGHKLSSIEKFFAKTSLAFVCYMHFQIEHIQGHHWNVATPKDPATSRLGESLYQFLPRTIYYSFISAWDIEAKRLKKANKAFWSSDNQMLWFMFWPTMITMTIYLTFGLWGAIFFLMQSAVGFLFLEVVNYVEHYGLLREEISPGHYEQVRPIHSWNANESVTNYFLFKLQRHSDHHTFPVRRYQVLRSFEESPQLPAGYSGCILLALVPPLWFYIMNPRVIQARKMIEMYRKNESHEQ
eukprot:TRINITY_DN2830_c0_g1_i1.p1 TRINITY_DN2830_c0_g1~~TRINITY_DN2830_c0_g1_i1.p1  ORF type:complete len:405 (-),score=84.89 TRINITY_DN2830_c0_g1_i1:288-1502(-)